MVALDALPAAKSIVTMAEEAFVYKAETRFGQSVRVVGNCPELGNWDPAKAPALTTDPSKYPMWFGSIQCQAPVEYKFVIFDEFQGAVWEEGKIAVPTKAARDQGPAGAWVVSCVPVFAAGLASRQESRQTGGCY